MEREKLVEIFVPVPWDERPIKLTVYKLGALLVVIISVLAAIWLLGPHC